MANNTSSIGAEALLRLIQYKKAEVLALLKIYGYGIKPNHTDVDIAYFVTQKAKKSHSFYNDLMKLMANEQVLTSIYSSMNGYSNADGAFCDKPENKSLVLCGGKGETKDKPKGSKFSLADALNLAQTGFNGYLQLDDNKTKRELAAASVRVSESGGSMSGNKDLPPKSNIGLYIGLGILGVSVIGLVVYLVIKKKA